MTPFTTRPNLQGTFGMVASTHWLASATAMSVLERGGNAADAATAAGFMLHVVEPHLNGPAGEVPILLSVRGGEPQVLCGQGPAPAGATVDHYRDLGLELVPGTGPLAAAVPGAVDAWLTLLRDHGSWRLRDVLDHAIGAAEHGHVPVPRVSATVETVRELFTAHWTTSAEVYLAGGEAPGAGQLFRNPALARTWQRMLGEAEAVGSDREAQIDAARKVWSQGFIAEAMVAAAARPTMDSSGEPHAGTLAAADLAGFEAGYEPTVTADWGAWTVHKAGAWSQAPAFLQQLNLLSDTAPGQLAPDGMTADVVHRLVEGSKLAFADREAWYGDAAEVPLQALLCDAYAEHRRQLVTDQASFDFRPGSPEGRDPILASHVRRLLAGERPAPSGTAGAGEPTVQRDGATQGDTCHVDVVDRWGTMISATPSGGWLQSNPVVPELGFPLGSRLQMTWLEKGLPNTLTPGRRPRTTLSPSMASYDGVPTLAFGTPGGDQQDQWSFQLFVALADAYARTGLLDAQAAIDAPAWHTDALVGSFWPRAYQPGTVTVEGNIDAYVVEALRLRGHRVVVGPEWSEGRLSAVGRHPATGVLFAAANPRGMQGYAAGR